MLFRKFASSKLLNWASMQYLYSHHRILLVCYWVSFSPFLPANYFYAASIRNVFLLLYLYYLSVTSGLSVLFRKENEFQP